MRNFLFLIFSILLSSGLLFPSTTYASETAEATSTCSALFVSTDPVGDSVETAIEKLIVVEDALRLAEEDIEGLIVDTSRCAGKCKGLVQKRLELQDVRAELEPLSDSVLDDEKLSDVLSMVELLSERIANIRDSAYANPDVESHVIPRLVTLNDLFENPELVQSDTIYNVELAGDILGNSDTHKLSVLFSPEIISFFSNDSINTAKYLRAIQRGYVAPQYASGLRRLVDLGRLIEVKVLGSEGKMRLLGCRDADGLIRLIKVYEKRNEGTASSFKQYKNLCD